jgi:hypothetical protein
MRLPFTDIKDIFFNIRPDNEQRLLVAADIYTLALTDCKKMSPVVSPYSSA